MPRFEIRYFRRVLRATKALDVLDATTFFLETRSWRVGTGDDEPQIGDRLEAYEDDVVRGEFAFRYSPFGWIRQDLDVSGCRFVVQIERAGHGAHGEACRATTEAEAEAFAARFLDELAAPLARDEARIGLEDRTKGHYRCLAGTHGRVLRVAS